MSLSQNDYGKTHDKVVFAQGAVLGDDYAQIEVQDIRHFGADQAMYINISDSNLWDYGCQLQQLPAKIFSILPYWADATEHFTHM